MALWDKIKETASRLHAFTAAHTPQQVHDIQATEMQPFKWIRELGEDPRFAVPMDAALTAMPLTGVVNPAMKAIRHRKLIEKLPPRHRKVMDQGPQNYDFMGDDLAPSKMEQWASEPGFAETLGQARASGAAGNLPRPGAITDYHQAVVKGQRMKDPSLVTVPKRDLQPIEWDVTPDGTYIGLRRQGMEKGEVIRGQPIAKENLPPVLYHVTTNLKGVKATRHLSPGRQPFMGRKVVSEEDRALGGEGIYTSFFPPEHRVTALYFKENYQMGTRIARGEVSLNTLPKIAAKDLATLKSRGFKVTEGMKGELVDYANRIKGLWVDLRKAFPKVPLENFKDGRAFLEPPAGIKPFNLQEAGFDFMPGGKGSRWVEKVNAIVDKHFAGTPYVDFLSAPKSLDPVDLYGRYLKRRRELIEKVSGFDEALKTNPYGPGVGGVEKYKKFDPDQIAVVPVKSKDIPSGAFIKTGTDEYVAEIAVGAHVPVRQFTTKPRDLWKKVLAKAGEI